MVEAHIVVTVALAVMTYTFWELSATKAVSSAARGNPAAPIPCSQPSVYKIPPAHTMHASCAHCCTHTHDHAPRAARAHVSEAGATPARLHDTALHPCSCDACSDASHGMHVPTAAQWHQCTEASLRLPCAPRNTPRASGTHWVPREDVVPSAAMRSTILLTGESQNHPTPRRVRVPHPTAFSAGALST